jgi:prefoldin subunit 5
MKDINQEALEHALNSVRKNCSKLVYEIVKERIKELEKSNEQLRTMLDECYSKLPHKNNNIDRTDKDD